uniref:C2H2-type domain-containing protein n=1 Tax=Panagrolaimus sp. ES5 TaxID=591445 RepID=A0AC34FBT8_9BILA
MDKSPLAMLEKTCETIGLPDTPAKKASPKTKDSSPSNDGKKKDLETIVTKSPRLNPIPSVDKKMMPGCEPSTSMAAAMFPGVNPNLMQRCFPFQGMPNPMAAGPMGYNPAMMPPYMMPPFMPPTSMPPMMMTPHMPNGRPCVQPGCPTCAAYSMAAFMPPDVMSQLSMLAAYSTGPAMNMAAMQSMNSGRHVCTYNGGNGPCGKTFSSESEHFAHLKSHVAESEQRTASNSEAASRNSSPPTEKKTLTSPKNNNNSNNRFHPYMKDSRSATPNNGNNNNNNANNMAAAQAAANAQVMAANNSAMAAQMHAILMNMGMMQHMGQAQNPLVSSSSAMPSSMSFPGMPGPQFNPAAFQAMLAAQQRAGMH